MENWENKLLAEKLNSLQDLPIGYTPDLSSKWEIVEAGLPGNRKRRIPLYIRWLAAAAVLLAIGLVWINVSNHSVDNYAAKPSDTQPIIKTNSESATIISVPKVASVPVREDTNQGRENIINEPKALAQSPSKPSLIFTSKDTNLNQQDLQPEQTNTVAQESISLPKAQIILPDTSSTFISEVAVIAPQEKTKPIRKKVYQRDFNDGVLAMDTGFTNTGSQHFSIKFLPFGKKAASSVEQPAQRLQLKQTF